jgi:hypothetical protein
LLIAEYPTLKELKVFFLLACKIASQILGFDCADYLIDIYLHNLKFKEYLPAAQDAYGGEHDEQDSHFIFAALSTCTTTSWGVRRSQGWGCSQEKS